MPRRNIFPRLKGELENRIHQLSPGDMLPGENALAAEFGVSRPTLRRALAATRDRLLKSEIRTFSINCWNEWTEGSMLEPEARYGYGYLDALKAVFPRT